MVSPRLLLLNFGPGVYLPLFPELVSALGPSLAAAGLLGTAFSLPRSLHETRNVDGAPPPVDSIHAPASIACHDEREEKDDEPRETQGHNP